jgi:mediator of RNA polymerase II transcription subunit 21
MSNDTKTEEPNGNDFPTKSNPGLPRSPKSNSFSTQEGRNRRSVSDILSISQFSTSKGRANAPEHYLLNSTHTPSTQTEIDGRSPTPTIDLRSASRDNDSHFDGNMANASFSMPNSSPSFQHSDGMEDIMIHKYLVEKNKVKACEAKNASLQAYVQELNMYILEQEVQFDRDRNDAERKLQIQEDKMSSLENYVKELEEKLSKQTEESKECMKSIHLNAENKIESIRQEGDTAMVSLRREIAGVRTEYATTKALLEQETDNLTQMTKRVKNIEQLYEQKLKEYENQVTENNILQSKLLQMKEDSIAAENVKSEEIQNLQDTLQDLNEMLNFKDEKGRELSDELKLMSYQYVESVERLEREKAKTLRLSKDVDDLEQKLKEQMKKNISITNQLEELSRGYIQMDKMHQMASNKIKTQTDTIERLETQLDLEKDNTCQLTKQLSVTTANFTSNTDEVLKLTAVAACLHTEIDSVNMSLADALSSVQTLEQKCTDSEERYSDVAKKLEQEEAQVAKLRVELEDATHKVKLLSNDLEASERSLDEAKNNIQNLSIQCAKQKTMLDETNFLLEKERSDNMTSTEEHLSKIASLSINLAALQTETKSQKSVIESTHSDLSVIKGEHAALKEALNEKNSENERILSTLDSERESFKEKSAYQQETIESLQKELSSLEQSHSSLFHSLVETESKLQVIKDELENAKFQLMTKDAEFKPVENMLKEEIMSKDKSLKDEQEKSTSLSTQLIEASKKLSAMHSSLVAAEERAHKIEEHSIKISRELSEKEKECKILSLNLEKEKNGPMQRKLKVAKKMIQAEKDRHRAILREVDAKNLIIERIEKQSETFSQQLNNIKKQLDDERRNKATHSARALQQLYKQLDDERKTMRNEKDELRSMLQNERDTTKSLIERVKILEGSSEIRENDKKLSNSLKEQHQNKLQVQKLLDENDKLKSVIMEQREKEKELQQKVTSMQNDVNELTISMDTLTKYCRELEEERRLSKGQKESSISGITSDYDLDDEDTVDCRSLSDFSVAQVPSPRQTHKQFLLMKTKIQESVMETTQGKADDDIELTVDARILYDD